MITKVISLVTFAVISISIAGCKSTYDINFTNDELLNQKWQVESSVEIDSTYASSLFNMNRVKSKIDITFTQKDLRENLDDNPIAEFYIKNISFVEDGKCVDFSKYIDKKIIGYWIKPLNYKFTCEGKTLDYDVHQVISNTGALSKSEDNYLSQFNRKNVSIGDKWGVDRVAVVKTQKSCGFETKPQNIDVTCKLVNVEKDKNGDTYFTIESSGKVENLFSDNESMTASHSQEIVNTTYRVTDSKDCDQFYCKGHYIWASIYNYKNSTNPACGKSDSKQEISAKRLH